MFVVAIVKKKGVKYLYDLSHEEKGFNETEECDNISYEFAKELKIGSNLGFYLKVITSEVNI